MTDPKTPDRQRAQFEKDFRSRASIFTQPGSSYPLERLTNGGYKDNLIQAMWMGWQAAYACGAADASERLKLAEQKLLEHDIVWDGRQYSFEPRSE